MKKKTYKKLENKYYRLQKRATAAEGRAILAEQNAEANEKLAKRFVKRFYDIGSHTKTISGGGSGLKVIQFELNPEMIGNWARLAPGISDEDMDLVKLKATETLARFMVENQCVQFIHGEKGPFGEETIGVKAFVVPWEQAAYKHPVIIRERVDEIGG